jgi:hypothetical protein
MPKSATPPLSVDCIACGTKMDLTAVEPRDHRTVYTYQCPSRHLQELAIPEQLSPPRTSPTGGFWKHLRSEAKRISGPFLSQGGAFLVTGCPNGCSVEVPQKICQQRRRGEQARRYEERHHNPIVLLHQRGPTARNPSA